ncbi:hypothetical protein FQR65_LT12950 [Abscondita terminalis]|nr:hypothetical protein FQR65_LT12950 [Abscondita terminalis]
MADDEQLPPGWKKQLSRSTGQHYYLNIYTKKSQWDVPDKPAETAPSSGPDQVQCSHLLVKHKDSRRPSSWREEHITRTKDEALDLILFKPIFNNGIITTPERDDFEKDSKGVGCVFFKYFKKHATKTMQIDGFTDEEDTYASVLQRIIRVALKMLEWGIKLDDTISLCFFNHVPFFAALFIGAKTICFDRSMHVNEAKLLLEQVDPKIMFVELETIEFVEAMLADSNKCVKVISFGESLNYEHFADLLVPHPEENNFEPVEVDETKTAFMFFSSGSTGMPKAIYLSHRAYLEQITTSGVDPSPFTAKPWLVRARYSYCCRSLSAQAKVFKRCELARELVDVHEIPEVQLPTWLCILNYESHYNTSAHNKGSGDHGLFQISEIYWCSPPGAACGVSCDDLKNDDIEDDVVCARRIYRQHQRLTGDGFNAWVVYNQHCKNKEHAASFLKGCDLSKAKSEKATTTMKPDQEEDKRKEKSPITLRILPQSEKAPRRKNAKKMEKASKQLNESGNKIPITVIPSDKNFKPMLHLLTSETDKLQ